MRRLSIVALTLSLLTIPLSGFTGPQATEKEDVARRGCCSHHGGVCGCQGSRAKCCDGTLSPSCGCLKDTVDDGLMSANDQECQSEKLPTWTPGL